MTSPTDDDLEAAAKLLADACMSDTVDDWHRDTAAAMRRAMKGRGTPVAWRWRWNGGCEPDVWVYCEHEVVSDRHRTAEPLYTTLSAAEAALQAADELADAAQRLEHIARQNTDNAKVWEDACEAVCAALASYRKARWGGVS